MIIGVSSFPFDSNKQRVLGMLSKSRTIFPMKSAWNLKPQRARANNPQFQQNARITSQSTMYGKVPPSTECN